MVVLVTAQPVLPGAKNFVKALLAEAEKRGVPVTTVVQNYNPRRTSVVLGEDEKVLYGKGFILDTLCGKTYALSPRSFYQVTPVQTAVLYGLASMPPHLTGKEVVLDAYCGIGTIGLTASDKARQVGGRGSEPGRRPDAIGNAKHNGVKNARFFAADATAWIREAADAGQKADGRLHGPAPGGFDARLHRERGPHGPEAHRLRQLQPRDDGPRPRSPDPERLPAPRASRRWICSPTAHIVRWSGRWFV